MKPQAVRQKVIDGQREMTLKKILICSLTVATLIVYLMPDLSFAVTEDQLKTFTETMVGLVTGSFMRLVAIGGMGWVVVKSYAEQNLLKFLTGVGIGVGGNAAISWAKTTFAFVI